MTIGNMSYPARGMAVALLSFGLGLPFSVASAQAVNFCAPRFVDQNVNDAVLAVKATRYCKNMPYTTAEAMAYVDRMRCSADASKIIDNLLFKHDADYQLLLMSDPNQTGCQKAAKIAVNERGRTK